MRQKPVLHFPPTIATRALAAALTLGLVCGSSASADSENRTLGPLVVPVQAAPPAERTPLVEPPAKRSLPGASPVPSDDSVPLLTPDIRPQGQVPNLKPDTPERKAEPKLPPSQKDAQPTPKQSPKPDLRADPKSPPPKSDPATPSAKSAKKAPADKPGLAVAQPRSAAEREKALSDLYAYLATADDEKQAATVSTSIEKLWVTSGSDTVSLLMQRAMAAANGKDPKLALKLLDAVVSLAPDYAEGWNRRAYVHYTQNEVEQALGDLRRTLALDPNHFKALDGLIHILKDIGRKKEALQAARRLLDVNPFYEGAKQVVDELSRELEGRGI
jgi:Tetratricopeptide repeat